MIAALTLYRYTKTATEGPHFSPPEIESEEFFALHDDEAIAFARNKQADFLFRRTPSSDNRSIVETRVEGLW